MKRILVIKLSSLGDLAHALPAVRALKARTGATIDWAVQPEYAALIGCCPDVERIIPFPRRNMLRGFGAFARLLRAEHYDLVVDFQGLLKSAVVARLAHTDWRVGPAWAREGARATVRSVRSDRAWLPRHRGWHRNRAGVAPLGGRS